MNKLYALFIVTIIIGCDSSRNLSIESLIENKDLDELKKRKKEYVDQMNIMKVELNEINNGISFLDENERLTLVSDYEIKQQEFNSYIETQANLKTRKNILILSEFQGTLERVFVEEGQEVRKGALLAQINDSGLQEQLEQLVIQTNFAKENFERVQRLWDNNIGSEMQYLKSKADYETSQKGVEQMRDMLSKTKIYAPFDGTIDEIISVITQTGNFINPNNRTFRIEVPVENPDKKIKQNLDAKIRINIYKKDDALVVPLRIIREDASGENYLYVMNEDVKEGVYITKKTYVKLGNKSNKDAEVVDGLNVGDLIVLEGANIVEDSQRVKLIK